MSWLGWLCAVALAGPWVPGTKVVQAHDPPTRVQWPHARQAHLYAEGHVPGAANAHWEELAGYDADGLWQPTEAKAAAALLAARGLRHGVPVVVYADWDTSWGGDGYLYWVLHYLGIDEVAVLDGGWDAWEQASGPIDARVPPPGDLRVVRIRDDLLATTAEVRAASEQRSSVLLDVRSTPEWLLGRVPNATHLRYETLADGDGRLLPKDALRQRLAEAGVTPEQPVITYCEGGIRAGHTFWVLDVLGFSRVSDYVGSWRAYKHADLPREW